jgi:phage head maturation protease
MSSLDILRKDALDTRIKGIAGGNRILWSAKDVSTIRDFVMAQDESFFRKASAAPARQDTATRSTSTAATRDIQPSDLNFLFEVSNNSVDRVGDTIDPNGIDCTEFNKNPVVLNSHDSSELPIASSSMPWVSGSSLMAVARFPQPGVSPASDQVAAAIRAGLVKGCSIGFVPVKWSFAKDRPLGINFSSVKMLEYSCCSIPCNPGCLLVGAVSAKSVDQHVAAARQAEARALTSQARSTSKQTSRSAPLSREQRLDEAAGLRRLAYRV